MCDQAGINFIFTFDLHLPNLIENCSKSDINWNHKQRFEAFMTSLSS